MYRGTTLVLIAQPSISLTRNNVLAYLSTKRLKNHVHLLLGLLTPPATSLNQAS
jgi:hypothetical protein